MYILVLRCTRYHEEAWGRIQALQAAIEALNKEDNPDGNSTEDLLNKVNTVLLGEKGRWLSSAAVAVQLGPLLPLLKEAILLCYAKTPGDPDSLTGSKQRMAQRVYAILDSPGMMYKMQAAAIMMRHIFQPLYDAIGRQNHTLFGGADGVRKVCEHAITTLGNMRKIVPNEAKSGKSHSIPNEVYFGGVVDCIRAAAESDTEARVLEFNRYIVSHVTKLERTFVSHFERIKRVQYKGSDICEEQWIACAGTSSFIKVPTDAAIQAAVDVAVDFDKVPAGNHDEWPEHMVKLLSKDGPLRKELDEFAMGLVNQKTSHKEPLRRWVALATHLSSFSKFQLTSSSWMESRFSVGSNAVCARPNFTTKAFSAFVRTRSNMHATEWRPEVFFYELFPSWEEGDDVPDMSAHVLRKVRELSCAKVKRGRDFTTDWDRLLPEAKRLKAAMKGVYACEFMTGFNRAIQALPAAAAAAPGNESDSDSDDDLPLMQQGRPARTRRGAQQDDEDGCSDDETENEPAADRFWKKSSVVFQHDEFGAKIPDTHPLAVRNSDVVFKGARGEIIELNKKVKAPKHTTVVDHCGGKLCDYEFYQKLTVYDESGDVHEIDLAEPGTPACMIRYGQDDDGDKLQQADILSIYLPPPDRKGIQRPHIEHGYLWDWEDIQGDPDCETFVQHNDQGFADNELVNSTSIYNSPAEFVECKILLRRGKENLEGVRDEYFWTRVIDLASGCECDAADIEKPLRDA